jgi:hypothetical protein
MKNVRLLNLFLGIVEILFQFIVVYPLQGFIWAMLFHESSMTSYNAAVLLLAAFLFYTVRKVSARVWQFLLGHLLALAGLLLLLPAYPMQIITGVSVVFLFLFSVTARFAREWQTADQPKLLHLGVLALVYIGGWALKDTQLMEQCFAMALTACVLYFLYWRLSALKEYVENNRDSAYFPERQVKRVSRSMLGIYTLLMTGCMILLSIVPAGPWVSSFGRGLLAALRWFFGLFRGCGSEQNEEPYVESTPVEDMTMPPVDENPGSPIWDWLWKIFSALILLLLAAGLVYLIVRLCARLYQDFYHKDDGDGDRKEFVRPTDRTDKVRRETKTGLGFGGTPSQKVRRIYRKKILSLKRRDQKLKESLTPREQTEEVALTDAKEMLALYEKARYGREECSKEDTKRMKELALGRKIQ